MFPGPLAAGDTEWGEPGANVPQEQSFRLQLIGPFRLSAPDGRRLDIRSKKAMAMLALLAMSKGGERARTWLQEKLWGSREVHQAQNSLRRELFNLRRITGEYDLELIQTTPRTIKLCLEHVQVDAWEALSSRPAGEFLEGLDLPGEHAFDQWLKATREELAARSVDSQGPDTTSPADVSPASPREREGITLLIFPFTVQGVEDQLAEDARSLAFRLFIEHLGRSKYFPISVWPALEDDRISMTETTEAVNRAAARYGLLAQVVSWKDAKNFSLSIFRSSDGQILWSEPTPLPEDVTSEEFWFAVQRMVNRTIQVISHDELQRANATEFDALGGTALSWIIRSLLYSSTKMIFEEARKYIDVFLEEHPHEPEPIILDSMYKIIHALKFGEEPPDEIVLRALANRANRANPTDVRGPAAAAFVEMMLGRIDRAIPHAEAAVHMVPGYIEGHSQLGYLYLLDGQLERGRETLERARALSPDPWRDAYTPSYLALYHALTGSLEQAIDHCNQSLMILPDDALPILIKVHCLIQLERLDEAEQIVLVQGPVVWERINKELRGLQFRDAARQRAFRRSVERIAQRTNQMFGTANGVGAKSTGRARKARRSSKTS